jgi:hypothetical protein
MKYRGVLAIGVVLYLFPFRGIAQDDSIHVHFHGTNTLVGQYASMQGVGQEIPASWYRNDLKMTLTVYDVPVSATFFITSMQSDYRQSINNFRIYLDVAALMKNKNISAGKGLVTSSVAKIESAKGELENSKNLLSSSILDEVKNQDILQKEMNKAKEKLDSSTSNEHQEIERARAKYDSLRTKVVAAQAKIEQGKAKLAEAESSLKKLSSKLDQARSIAASPDLAKNGEAAAKKLAMSKMGRFLSNFTTLEIGKCRPNYTELTLKGISVSGVNIEFNPAWFYVAFSTGKVKRSIVTSLNAEPTYRQDLVFGKLGFGRKKGTHFYFTYMEVKDKAGSQPDGIGINAAGLDTLGVKPQANFILGTDFRLALFKKKFTVDAEAGIAMFTRDTRSPELDMENSDVPAWLRKLVQPKMSSSADYAYDVKSTLTLKTTTVSLGVRRVGAGYITLGNPNLINDRFSLEGKIDQSIAKSQVTLSAWYRQSHDNLINWKTGCTKTVNLGIIAGFHFRKLPYLQLSYTPYFQKTAEENNKLENNVEVISATTGYNYKIGKMRANTMFSFFYQGTSTILDSLTMKSENQTYSFNQDLAFKIPLSLGAGVSFSRFEYGTSTQNTFQFTVSGTYGAFKNKWQNSLGVKYANQDYEQNKLGFFLNSRVHLWKMVDLEIRVENNAFHDILFAVNNYSEWIVQSTLAFRW